MAASWRALHQLPDINLHIIAFQACTQTAFSDQLMQGISCHLLDLKERQNARLIKDLVTAAKPDIIVISGWLHSPYRQLTFAPELSHVPFVMGMDTPWWGTWKQYFAPYLLRSYLKRMERVMVAGERSWQYAYRLGIQPQKIIRGLYGVDYDTWSPLWAQRLEQGWSRSFLFIGRYAQDKAIDVLVKAYSKYRSQVSDPWKLVCCGKGEMASQLEGQIGINNQGFMQPTEMPDLWRDAGALILPSRFDPWPLSLVEAAATGLPIICTDACGSAVEVVRPGYNGLVIPPEDPQALTQAILTLHHNYTNLPTWGKRSQQLAAPYGAKIWAQRWQELINDIYRTKHNNQITKLSTAKTFA